MKVFKVHVLKILPKFFRDVLTYKKNFEVRKFDRDFKVGDLLVLKEWDGHRFTGRFVTRQIVYVLEGDGSFGLSLGFCVLGLKPVPCF